MPSPSAPLHHDRVNLNPAVVMHFSDTEDAIRDLLRANGGKVGAHMLGVLYRRHAGMRDCINEFGGAKRFCERSDCLEFVPDGGSGEIRADTEIDELEGALEDTQAQLREAHEAAELASAEAQALRSERQDSERQLAEAEASRRRADMQAAQAEAAARAATHAAAVEAKATAARETKKAVRDALAAATAAEAKAAGLGIGAQVLVNDGGGVYVHMHVGGYRGSQVEVEDSGTQKTYILLGETIAEVATIQSQRRELQAKDPDIFMWECDINGAWTPFSDTLSHALEAAHSSGIAASGVTMAGVFKRAEHSYAVDWQRMVQINEKTAVERPIRRTIRLGARSSASTPSPSTALQASPKTPVEPIIFMSNTIHKYTLKPTGAQVSGAFEEYHLGIAYKQVHQMLHAGAHAGLAAYHHRHTAAGYVAPRISKVEYFDNPFLEQRFDATKQQMGAAEEQCKNTIPPPPAAAFLFSGTYL